MADIAQLLQQLGTMSVTPQQTQSFAEAVPTVQQSKDFIQHDAVDYKGQPITIFSTDGVRKSEEQFAKAIELYNNSKGKRVEGFTFLEPGVVNTLRSTFEKVNQPLQQAAQAIGDTATPPPSTISSVGDMASATGWLAKQMPAVAASTVNTPERAMTTAGTLGAMAATGGYSLLPQMLAVGGVAGGSNLAAQHLFGSAQQKPLGQQLKEAGTEAFVAAGLQGFTGYLKTFINRGVSQRAQAGVAEELFDYIKTRFGSLTGDKDIIEIMGTNPRDVSRIVQIGAKGLRGDIADVAQGLKQEVYSLYGSQVPDQRVRDSVSRHVRSFVEKSNDLVDALGDSEATAVAKDALNDVVVKLTKEIQDATMKSVRDPQGIMKALQVRDILDEHLKTFYSGAQLLDVLERAGTKTGFDIRAIQRELQGMYQQQPGSTVEQAGNIAGRGAPLTQGIDEPVRLGIGSIPIPYTRLRIPLSKEIGTKYVGDVSGTLPKTTVGANATILAIRDYLKDQGSYQSKDYRR